MPSSATTTTPTCTPRPWDGPRSRPRSCCGRCSWPPMTAPLRRRDLPAYQGGPRLEGGHGRRRRLRGIAPTTFSLMRARMVVADADGKLFEKTLEKAVAAGIFGKEKLTAIVDSSPVYGAGAVCDTYELIRGFVRRFIV